MNNQQIEIDDLFEFIGRQALDNYLLRKQTEQLKTMLRQAQNGIVEAQEVAKKLHHQMQKSAIENNGAELVERETSHSTK